MLSINLQIFTADQIIELLFGWFFDNLLPISVSAASIIFGYILYIILKKQIFRARRKERIDETTTKNLTRLIRLVFILIIFTIVSVQFAENLGYVSGLISVVGGTVLGFAAMSTLGNIIAGIIVLSSKPFRVGDRIIYNGKIADVIDIKLVYTVLKDIDGVKISVPNQKLLKEQIENLGKNKILRREIFCTAGYEEDPRKVEKALFEAVDKFSNILKTPGPRVDLYHFDDYAVRYRLLFFINNSKLIPRINHDVRKAVFFTAKEYKIDLSTPMVIQQLGKNTQT